MRKWTVPMLTVTMTAAALLAAGTAGPASASPSAFYTGYGWGVGATSQAAESAAIVYLDKYNYYCDWGTTLVYDTQQSSGSWMAEVSARCMTGNTH